MKIKLRLLISSLLALCLLLVASGCSSVQPSQALPDSAGFPLTITDDSGRSVTIERRPQRLVSLAPSNTELAFALELEQELVGVTEFCNYPAAAAAKEKIGGTTGKTISLEKVISLQPDLVLAANLSGKDLVSQLEAHGIAVLVLSPKTLEQIIDNIAEVGSATGRPEQAAALTTSLKQQIQQISAKGQAGDARPRVLFEIDAGDPARVFTAGPGSFAHEMIVAAGGANIAAAAGSPWPTLSLEEIVSADPEIIICAHPGSGSSAAAVAGRPGWGDISAVKRGAVFPLDNDLVSRPGPRIGEGLAAIAAILQPQS